MKLIDEIIEILGSDGKRLSDALIKTKILLHKIGHKELTEWVNNELNSYPEETEVPSYRILPAQVLANIVNRAYQISSHPIPLGHLPEELRNNLETAKMYQSLAILEKYMETDNGNLRSHIAMEFYGVLGEQLANDFQIQRAWSEVQIEDIAQILVQVRSRLLDFMLELNEELSEDLDEEQVKARAEEIDATKLFNSAVFGNNTTIIVGSGNTQTVTNLNIKGNFEALSKILKKNGVAGEDIQSLDSAIKEDADTVNDQDKDFGPAVKRWLQKMLTKAVDTSWKIELNMASSLLATALNNYYGWF